MSSLIPPPRPAVRVIGLALLVLLNAAHLYAYAGGSDQPWQLAIFALSLIALPWLTASGGLERPADVGATPPIPGEGPLGFDLTPLTAAWARWQPGPRLEAAVATAVIGLGIFLRVFQWDSVPAGIWSDELLAAANGVRILEGVAAPPFGTLPLVPEWPTWVHTFNLYSYSVAALLKVFGVTHFGIKSLSILPGCLTILGFYWLLRELGGPRLAALGTLALDLSRWHLTQSRFEWDATFMVMGAVFGVAATVRGLRTGRIHWMAVGGICLGLIQYSYLASRLAAVAAVGWLGILFILGQRATPGFRKRLIAAGLAWGLAFGVAAGPVMVFHLTNEEIARARIKQVTIDEEENPAAAEYTLEDNVKVYLGMFRREGPGNARQNIPGEPLLPPEVGFLAAVGAVLALRWRSGVGASMSWAFFACALAGGVLSDHHGGPNSHRVGLVVPIIYLWATVGLEALAALAGGLVESLKRPQRAARQALALAAAAAVLVPGVRDSWAYFHRFGASTAHWRAVRAAPHLQLARFLKDFEDTHELWIDLQFDDLTVDLLLWEPPIEDGGQTVGGLTHHRWRQVPISAQGLLPEPTGERPILLAVKDAHRKALSSRYPKLDWQIHNDPWDREMFATLELSADQVRRMRQATLKKAVGGKGDVVFTREDLKGKGIVRLVYDRFNPRQLIGGYVERLKALKNAPYGPLLRQGVRMEWHAWLSVAQAGDWRFAEASGSSRGELWLDGKKVQMGRRPTAVELSEGRHSFLFKGNMNVYRRLTLQWKGPKVDWEPIPGRALAPRLPRGFKGALEDD